MDLKLIAIGNRIMGDDGVAIEAAESLREELEQAGVQVIIGETDVAYCFNVIRKGDFIILLDAAISGRTLGTVWKQPLAEAIAISRQNQSQHDADLLTRLGAVELQLSGLLICIEVEDIELRFGLSDAIKGELPRICSQIRNLILQYRGE